MNLFIIRVKNRDYLLQLSSVFWDSLGYSQRKKPWGILTRKVGMAGVFAHFFLHLAPWIKRDLLTAVLQLAPYMLQWGAVY
jgi:hypothetical protein